LGIPFSEATARIGLCAVARAQGDFDVSLDEGRRALELARGTDMQEIEVQALGVLCDTYLSLGDLEGASEVSSLADDLAARLGAARFIAQAKEGRAHVLHARGETEAAREFWHAALAAGPGHVVDLAGPRAHLAATGSESGVCWRCRLAA
jgi:ATP/maltotriose-dependent transcriptional regulator MalT